MMSLALNTQLYNDIGAANERGSDFQSGAEGPMVTFPTNENVTFPLNEANGEGGSEKEEITCSVKFSKPDGNDNFSSLLMEMENATQLEEVGETSLHIEHDIDYVEEDDPQMNLNPPQLLYQSCPPPPLEKSNYFDRESGNQAWVSPSHGTDPQQSENGERYTLRRRTDKVSHSPSPTSESTSKSGANSVTTKKIKINQSVRQDDLQWPCIQCNRSFKRASDLRQHENNAHGRKPGRTKSTCKVCGKVFVREVSLTVHMRSHTNEKPFHCPSCPLRYAQKHHVIRHLRLQHGEEATSPTIDSFREVKNSQRSAHRLAELLNLLRPCKLVLERCDPLLPSRSNLKSTPAVDAEEGSKSLHCRLCWRSFSNKSALIRHEKIYSGQEPRHTCPKCGKSFLRKDNLSCHIKSVHDTGREKQYNCKLCNKSYSQKANLEAHVLAHHSGRKLFSCRKCNMRCGYARNLRRHMVKFHST